MDELLIALAQVVATAPVPGGDAFSIIRIIENVAGQTPLAGFCYFLWNERKALQRENTKKQEQIDKIKDERLEEALETQAEQLESNHEQTAALNALTAAIQERNGG